MVKVCHITTVHTNRYDVRIFKKECIALANAGFEVTLLVNDDMPDEMNSNVRITSLRHTVNNRLERVTRVANFAYKKAIEVNADVYHIHDPELLPIAVKLRRKNKIVIFDSHEFTAMQLLTKPYIPTFARKILSQLYRMLESICLNRISGIVVPCTYKGEDYFANLDVPKVIIGNYPLINSNNRISYPIEEKENKICYIGGISESRGAIYMVKAAYLSGVKLVLIGNISHELLHKLEEMPEYKNVEYLGVLPHEDTLDEVAKCRVGLTLLQNDGQYMNCDNLSTKTYEYMMLGLPVIMSDAPFWVETLKDYRFGLSINPCDVEAISLAISTIINDCDLQKCMAQEGIRAIETEMNWNMEAEKLCGFYFHLIDNSCS